MDRKDAPALAGDRLAAVVEAVLFASGEPVQPVEIAEAFDLDGAAVEAALDALRAGYKRKARGGLALEAVAGGFRLATRSDIGDWVRQFFRRRNRTRLSPAALETLAIVAYRQPVTLPEIQAIRGRDPSAALKNLVDKRLLRILGKKKVVGHPLLYGTSKQFLIHFGLDSLEDLPSIDDFDQFMGALEEASEPQGDRVESGSDAPETQALQATGGDGAGSEDPDHA